MPRKKWIDKSQSTTYSLVHRSQNDPLIHDETSNSMVFRENVPPQAHKAKSRRDLEADLFKQPDDGDGGLRIRDNEGEAAEYGIYFDDTEYDYMQHMRDIGGSESGDGERHFVEAKAKGQGKGKIKMRLEDALRRVELEDRGDDASTFSGSKSGSLLSETLPTNGPGKSTYQDQQDVPDVLAGFQPDMNPRLREVLEALDDEAYVDNEDDIFGEIAKDGREVSLAEFEDMGPSDEVTMDDDGWETDGTEKPGNEYKANSNMAPVPKSENVEMEESPDHGDGDWMKEFSKFKKDAKDQKAKPQTSNADMQSSLMTGTSMTGGRRKKRKGAMTSSTGYSMTSSSLFRTEGQTLLDARFDKIEEAYAEDALDDEDGGVSVVTGTTGNSISSSQAPPLVSKSGFDSMMDDFLGSYSMNGKKRIKKSGYQSGIEQLDEIRKGLGPAKLKAQKI